MVRKVRPVKKRLSLSEHDAWERDMAARQDAALAAPPAPAASAATSSGEQAAMFARIDERTKIMAEDMKSLVTQAEFRPVKTIAFGLLGLIAIAVVGAIIALVVVGGG